MPEYFQYHFCKWYCVLPVLQNTVVSPTYRYTHTHTVYLLEASQGPCVNSFQVFLSPLS